MITMNTKLYTIKDLNTKEFKEALSKAVDHEYVRSNYSKPMINQTVVTYDSETNNYKLTDKDKRPFVFSLTVTVLNPKTKYNVNFNARTINDFKKFLTVLAKEAGVVFAPIPLYKKDGSPSVDAYGNQLYDQSKCKYLNIYVHNLSFDISFLMHDFDFFSVFASDKHHAYYATTTDGFKWIDTARLTQSKLAELGSKLKKYKMKKAVGDFDYDKSRVSITPFTKKEEGYVVDDTLTLAAHMDEGELEEVGGNICDIPLTATAKVRKDLYKIASCNWDAVLELYEESILTEQMFKKYPAVAAHVFRTEGKAKKADQAEKDFKAKYDDQQKRYVEKEKRKAKDPLSFIPKQAIDKFRQVVEKQELRQLLGDKPDDILSYEVYEDLKQAYAGGFTHANPLHLGKVEKDVRSFDFTSSYPTVLVSEKYPKGDAIKVDCTNQEKLFDRIKHEEDYDEMFIFEIEADSAFSNTNQDFYFSKNKLIFDEKKTPVQEFNGRIRMIGHFRTWITGADWEIVKQCYTFSNLRIVKAWKWHTAYLPLYFIASVLKYYQAKTKLKGVKGRERDYMRGKMRINALYGMSVQDCVKSDIKYDQEKHIWIETKPNQRIAEKILEKYSENPKRVLQYTTGVMCASYARRNLWTGILACGDDYIYSDTDSIKILNYKQHLDYVNQYNEQIVLKITKCLNHYGLNLDLQKPRDIKGKQHQLGVWDPNDGFYKAFKTLGAKRYVTVEKDSNAFGITIAGLSKSKGAEYILKASKTGYKKEKGDLILTGGYMKAFNFFNNNMYVPAKYTGKLAHTYVDSYSSFTAVDYQGKKEVINSGSGCYLGTVDFTMSLADKTLDFVEKLINQGVVEVPDQTQHVSE